MIEKQIAYITKAKHQSKEDFIKNNGEGNLHIWELLQKSKEGYITIKKVSANLGYLGKNDVESGYTPAFGEGLSCYIDKPDSYYYTSVIQSIDWEQKIFKTMNSIYKFEFDESKN